MLITVFDKMKEILKLFNYLESDSRRTVKEYEIQVFKNYFPEAADDLDFCFEVLDGQHKLGYSLAIRDPKDPNSIDFTQHAWQWNLNHTLREFCSELFNCESKDALNLKRIHKFYEGFGFFLNPLFNRQWRLGIGKSQLKKKATSPMLAKKYEPGKVKGTTFSLTEKLDGNRCIAQWDTEANKWIFNSRSGKELKVNFDIPETYKNYVFDGEILSLSQLSKPSQANFNKLSGIINSKDGNKSQLVYMIFDIIIEDLLYATRRRILDGLAPLLNKSQNVRVLPVLATCTYRELDETVNEWLDTITSKGGEGVMINSNTRYYEQKRTDALLKCKRVYTMDMKVEGIIPGTGKNTGLVGSLVCFASGDGKSYDCQVGSGLNDAQRADWADHPEHIIGKIVEVAYFSESQDAGQRGTNSYSLRFPRLKGVRTDKDTTSIY